MSNDECIHGMTTAWCATCSGRNGVAEVPIGKPLHGSRSKQNLLDDLCDDLQVARYSVRPGSTLPQRIFHAAATRAKVQHGSTLTVSAAIAAKAGLDWGPECATRTGRKDVPTVTREGLEVVVRALGILAKAPVAKRARAVATKAPRVRAAR